MFDRAVVAAALFLASPAAAQEGAWQVKGDRAEAPSAKLSLPIRVAGLTLTQTGEFSNKGKAIDNFAQFKSPDGKVFVTVYVYRTTYPDAALADHATDRAVRARFGEKVRRASETVIPLAGRADAAIRAVYEGGELNGAPTVTAAAFARAGDWLVKLRASGPTARRAEVIAAFDAAIAGVGIAATVPVPGIKPLALGPACPAADAKDAKLVKSKESNADAILGGLLGNVAAAKPDRPPSFPGNGSVRACIRGIVGLGPNGVPLLQPADEATATRMVAALNDAGMILSVEPALLGRGYVIKTYVVGAVETRGTVDRMPTAGQLARWFASSDAEPLRVRSRTLTSSDGNTTVELNAKSLR